MRYFLYNVLYIEKNRFVILQYNIVYHLHHNNTVLSTYYLC